MLKNTQLINGYIRYINKHACVNNNQINYANTSLILSLNGCVCVESVFWHAQVLLDKERAGVDISTYRIVRIFKLLVRNQTKIHSWYSLRINFPDKRLFSKHVKIGLWFISMDYISLKHVKGKISIQNQIFHNGTLQSWLQHPRCHIDDRWLNGASERIWFGKRRLGD